MAKGYGSSGDILTRTRDGQDLNAIWATYAAALESFNAARQPLISLLSSTVTDVVEDIVQPGQERFEQATDYGIAVSIRPQPIVTQRAYPFSWWDIRAGYTFQFLAGNGSTNGASQAQLDTILSQAMEADNQLQMDMVMKALFNSANRTAMIGSGQYATGNPFTVTALYNADSSYIPPYKGQTFNGASHTHYVGSGVQATNFDPADFIALALLVEEHGFTRANGYNVIFLMNPADASAGVSGFQRGVAYNSVTSKWDFIPAQGQNFTLMLPAGVTLTGGQPGNTFAGLDVAGSYGPYLIVQDYQIPAGYMVAVATQGQSTNTNVIGLREHPNAQLQGLIIKPGNNANYPLIDSHFIRGIGSGVRQRGAAAVMQLNSATYTVPAAMAW